MNYWRCLEEEYGQGEGFGRGNGVKACTWCREGFDKQEFGGMRDRGKRVSPNPGAVGVLGGFSDWGREA